MRLTVPDYYDRFRCIASRCTDNCCIGWEIGIDPAALADYQSQTGAFGDRLRAAIQPGDPPYFALTDAGRCPFLNSENLCDIYRQLGETHLCAICDQHPRFHNWFGAEKESGLGLSCEEAARLILFSAPPRLTSRQIEEAPDTTGAPDPELLAGLRAVRESAFALLREESLPLAVRLALLASLTQDLQSWMDGAPEQAEARGILNELEPHTTSLYFALGKRLWFSQSTAISAKITTRADLDLFEGHLLLQEKRKREQFNGKGTENEVLP